MQVGRFCRTHFFSTNSLFSNLFHSRAIVNIRYDKPLFISFSEDQAFKKKRQLINSTDLNRLLRSPIYPYPDGQLHAAYLILGYSPVYRSFQAARKAITIKHPLLPYIDVCCKGYILSPSESARREEGRYHSKSPPLFTPEDLGVTLAIPTPSDRPRRQRRKKTNRDTTNDLSPPREELNIPAAIPLDDPSSEMTLQRSRVTLAQVLARPVRPQGQTPTPTLTSLLLFQLHRLPL